MTRSSETILVQFFILRICCAPNLFEECMKNFRSIYKRSSVIAVNGRQGSARVPVPDHGEVAEGPDYDAVRPPRDHATSE
jgi:hypothetical protein